jgi:hypothetical protein
MAGVCFITLNKLSKVAYACLENGNTLNELVLIAIDLRSLAEAKLNVS